MQRQHKTNVLLTGDVNVGKSTLIRYMQTNHFDDTVVPTVEVSRNKYKFTINGEDLEITMEDTPGIKSGDHRFEANVFSEFQNCAVIVFIYDKTHRESFEQITYLRQIVNELVSRRLLNFLVGNKCDMTSIEQVTAEEGLTRCAELDMDLFLETSAINGTNVHDLFRKAAVKIKAMNSEKGKTIKLHDIPVTSTCPC
ncbi:RAB1A [Mytilus coruscus]|uniref:RAB1A n=1 Tax=Mytilus coruscus TaxID=42192 RepID=A0A6J8BKG5_MYTCO|nr:RAB1A [Mytilus coruscus]